MEGHENMSSLRISARMLLLPKNVLRVENMKIRQGKGSIMDHEGVLVAL